MNNGNAPELRLEIRRLRSVDLNRISGGGTTVPGCRTTSACGPTQGSLADSSGGNGNGG